MLHFMRDLYRGGMTVILWIILILFTVGGGYIGHALSGYRENRTFAGIIIGLILGLLIDVIWGGYTATILNMDDNLEEIRTKMNDSNHSSADGTSSGINLSNVSPISPTKVNTGDTWVCKKCKERNPITASSCKGCGAYK